MTGKIQGRLNHLLRHRLAADIGNLFAGKLGAMIAGFLALTFATRLSDRADFGAYSYGLSLVNICLLFGLLGFQRLIVREVAKKSIDSSTGTPWQFALQVTFRAVALLVLVVLVAYFALPYFSKEQGLLETARLSLLLVIPFGLLRLTDAYLRGRKKFRLSPLPDQISRPLFFAAGIFIVFSMAIPVTADQLVLTHLLAAMASLGLAGFLSWKTNQPPSRSSANNQTSGIYAEGVSLGYVAITAALLSQLPVMFLGYYASADEVALYAAPARIGLMVGLLFTVVNQALAPSIAQLWQQGNLDQMSRVASTTSALSLGISITLALPIIIFPGFFLDTLLGDQFTDGKVVLQIITCTQLFHVASGSVTSWLTMTGKQNSAARANIATLIIACALSIVLVPRYSEVGAACVFMCGIIISNTIQGIAVYKQLGFNPSALGAIKYLRTRSGA